MFSETSVILSTGRGVRQTPPPDADPQHRQTPPQKQTPLEAAPPEAEPPGPLGGRPPGSDI